MKKAQKDLKKQAWKGSKKPDEDAHEEDAAPAKRLRKKTPTRPSMTAGLKDTASKAAQSDEADVATDQKSQTSQDAQERKQRATKDEPERSKGKSAKGESSKSKSMSQVSGSSKTEAKTDKVGKDKRQTDKPKKEKRKSRKQEHPTAEDEADKSKDQKQKRDRQSEPASEKLRGRPAVEDFEACLREFEDSAEEPAPPKSRKLAPTSSGPEIDEEDMWWELELFRNRNYELREEADWDADQGWDQWDGDAVEGWGGGEQEWLEDGQGESEVVADSNRKRHLGAAYSRKAGDLVDPSQEDTQDIDVASALGTEKYIEDQHGILRKPPRYLPKNSLVYLFPGLREDYESEHSQFSEDCSCEEPQDDDRKRSPSHSPVPEDSEVEPTKTGDAAANKINSTNHRKEWNKLDRIAKNRADTYPTLAKMWNTSTETRNKVLRQFVYSEGVAEKVEATLNWEISTGKKSNRRRAKLTVKQMQSAPHFFAPEKIRKIVSEQEGIPDEVTPHLKKTLGYWCYIEDTEDNYNDSR